MADRETCRRSGTRLRYEMVIVEDGGNLTKTEPRGNSAAVAETEPEIFEVWIDQNLCTGDGLCVQEARDVFEFDLDGLAYVKDPNGDLLTQPGARTVVPAASLDAVLESARRCPGACIHVVRARDGVEVAGPDAGE